MTEMEELKARLDLIEVAVRQSYKDGAHANPKSRMWLLDALWKESNRSEAHTKIFAEWEQSLGMRHPLPPS